MNESHGVCLIKNDIVAGSVPGGLVSHPHGHHIVYPLGCTVIVEDVQKRTQTFLSGHSDTVSCLACSPSGSFIASGQVGMPNSSRAPPSIFCPVAGDTHGL